ncbi:MAG: iron-sulfur cluster assembly accessory protein [Pirellulaceae bacterium]|jgi:iron-sulfur cluster assembly protein|nr:iron-sulfur cluster assembly accessory protein [Pirellulaceae bacterium]MDP7018265.1 iron-sulfur cluster assembly accessory protein [Pirellulaceae bacterium]
MITVTETAATAAQATKERSKYGEEYFLRIGVVGGGCSGFAYKLTFDTKYDETKDTRYEMHGMSYVVDKKSSLFLDGATLNYADGIERQGFYFDNPNVVKTCGCGSSFSV